MKILIMIIITKPLKKFTDKHFNYDPSKTPSDSEITINSIKHHLPDSFTSVENLIVKIFKNELI